MVGVGVYEFSSQFRGVSLCVSVSLSFYMCLGVFEISNICLIYQSIFSIVLIGFSIFDSDEANVFLFILQASHCGRFNFIGSGIFITNDHNCIFFSSKPVKQVNQCHLFCFWGSSTKTKVYRNEVFGFKPS